MSKKIICIGEVLWDVLPHGMFLGGAPFNVACHLNMLGEPVAMVSRVGPDEPGDRVLRRMKMMGLSTEHIQLDPAHDTGIVHVTLERGDHPVYDIVAPAAWDFIELPDALQSLAGQAAALVFGSLAQRSATSRNTIEQLRKLSKRNVFDVNLRPPYDRKEVVEASLRDAQVVKLNDTELRRMADWFGLPGDLQKAARALAEAFDCETVCITRGGNGAALWHRHTWSEHPGFSVPVKDTIGAGDAFLAALLSGLLADRPAEKILAFANAVGAFVAMHSGATPRLDLEEINRIRHRGN